MKIVFIKCAAIISYIYAIVTGTLVVPKGFQLLNYFWDIFQLDPVTSEHKKNCRNSLNIFSTKLLLRMRSSRNWGILVESIDFYVYK